MLNAAYIEELVEKAAKFGGGRINIIVNNAGFTWDAVIHKVSSLSHQQERVPKAGRKNERRSEGGRGT